MKNQKIAGGSFLSVIGGIALVIICLFGIGAIIDRISGPGTVGKFVESLGDTNTTSTVTATDTNGVATSSSSINSQIVLPVDTQLVTISRTPYTGDGFHIYIVTKPRPLSVPATTYDENEYLPNNHTLVGKLTIVEQ